ncbi:ABC transporter permease subunit [Infirmifilum lucidum]|uniref:ABC transporter permease subunit n=1 Tax=Infirmifilum lucidum TaxID=2776706 RepID=A0A7L9FI02_9CREN|nr:ABC transporter permease subunit [Infirmifilum lucidum]QOJ79347.1 ABC transporter permease subunit [Infirmifilum lucidum]
MRIGRLLLDRAFLVFASLATLTFLSSVTHIAAVSLARATTAFVSEGIKVLVAPPGPPGGELGGIGPILVGTLFVAGLALFLAAPLGVVVGVYLSETREGLLPSVLSLVVYMLSEIPTIVIGLFVFSVICVPMKSYSALAGATSLAIAILPFIVTQVREAINSIPPDYREAAYSLGLPRWKTVWLILVPMARPGVLSGILLGLMKALGETAPVLLTAGFALYGFYGLTGPSNTLSLAIYRFSVTPYENYRALAWTAASILLVSSVVLSYATRRLAGRVRF